MELVADVHFPCISLYKFFEISEKFLKFFFWNCLIFFLSSTTMLNSSFSVKASQKPFPKKFLKNFLKLSDPPPIPMKIRHFGAWKQTNSDFPAGNSAGMAENQKSVSNKISAKVIPFRKYIHVGVEKQPLGRKNSVCATWSKYS